MAKSIGALANTSQAKGRVERNHAVYQDRFVKELKLKGITTIPEANALLSEGFVNKLNQKFAKPASSDEDAHVALTAENDLDQIFCWEEARQLKNDWTVQFEKSHYQVEKSEASPLRAKTTIVVRKHMDGRISLWYQDEALKFHETVKEAPKVKEKEGYHSEKRAVHARANKHKTPWSQFNPDWLSDKSTICGQEVKTG
jgi:hypothetical protein